MIPLGLTLPNNLTLSVESFLQAHPALINDIGGQALFHAFYSYSRSRRKRGVNRRRMRKAANMKRRWFIDNIVMHHRRLHAQNRNLIIKNARERALQKRKKSLELQKTQKKPVEKEFRSRTQGNDFRERIEKMRGRIDSRKTQARSRWLTVSKLSND